MVNFYLHQSIDVRTFGFPKKKKISKIKIKDILEYPPTNEKELQYSLLEYFKSKYFHCPISMSLLKRKYFKINRRFLKCEEILENLDFEAVIKDLEEQKAIKIEQNCVGLNMQKIIVECDKNKCIILAREYHNNRPKKMPKLEEINEISKEIAKRQKKRQKDDFEKIQFENLIKKTSSVHAIEVQKVEPLKPEICEHETRSNCFLKISQKDCMNTHYYKLLLPDTIESLGLCEFKFYDSKCEYSKCKYIHYQKEPSDQKRNFNKLYTIYESKQKYNQNAIASQWINCDLRHFNYSILGKFDAIMLDPPWDIHMNLPYGTLKDKEMLALNVEQIMDNGIIFLWVTMRALELGRQCLQKWGYNQVEELVWVKTNQLGRIVRTGRTGHWLNHSKEHCLVGIKGDVSHLNRNIDCDVLVTEVRETSRKPDEIYQLIERIAQGGRKCELFARPHNRRRGWVSLGNQLPGIYIVEEDMLQRFQEKYPEMDINKIKQQALEIDEQNPEFIHKVYHSHLN